MNETTSGFTPFKQVPTWEEDAIFTMTGKQVTAIQNMCEAYSNFISVMEGFFVEHLTKGNIVIKYEDLDGNPLQKEDIDAMLQLYAQTLAQNMSSGKEPEIDTPEWEALQDSYRQTES